MEKTENRIEVLEKRIGYAFRNRNYLETALLHKSYYNGNREKGNMNNERMEFLGDAFLDAVVGEELYRRLPDTPEGPLTRLRADLVCEKSLYEIGRKLELGEFLFLSPGEEKGGGRTKPSILSDAVEAVFAAVYLDGGFEACKKVVLDLLKPAINETIEGHLAQDYKTILQETLQKNGPADIVYREENESGPDHMKTFVISVSNYGKKLGTGTGHSKKEAEMAAAKEALNHLQ